MVHRGRQHVNKRRFIQCTEAGIEGLMLLEMTTLHLIYVMKYPNIFGQM